MINYHTQMLFPHNQHRSTFESVEALLRSSGIIEPLLCSPKTQQQSSSRKAFRSTARKRYAKTRRCQKQKQATKDNSARRGKAASHWKHPRTAVAQREHKKKRLAESFESCLAHLAVCCTNAPPLHGGKSNLARRERQPRGAHKHKRPSRLRGSTDQHAFKCHLQMRVIAKPEKLQILAFNNSKMRNTGCTWSDKPCGVKDVAGQGLSHPPLPGTVLVGPISHQQESPGPCSKTPKARPAGVNKCCCATAAPNSTRKMLCEQFYLGSLSEFEPPRLRVEVHRPGCHVHHRRHLSSRENKKEKHDWKT